LPPAALPWVSADIFFRFYASVEAQTDGCCLRSPAFVLLLGVSSWAGLRGSFLLLPCASFPLLRFSLVLVAGLLGLWL
jgi:hypothetical protein